MASNEFGEGSKVLFVVLFCVSERSLHPLCLSKESGRRARNWFAVGPFSEQGTGRRSRFEVGSGPQF